MATTLPTTCPKCKGKAYKCTDDGITYCEENSCSYFGIADSYVKEAEGISKIDAS